MPPLLYSVASSPPCRAVQMTAESIGLDLQVREMDAFNGELNSLWFLKLNPQHTVPTLEDNSFVVWDSHAIMIYLVSKYARNDSLYPKDLKKRAVVDQRLHFENGVIWPRVRNLVFPVRAGKQKYFDQQSIDAITEVYAFLEEFLDGKLWMAGDSLTIADFSIVATISMTNLEIVVPIDPKKFPRVAAWFKRCESLPVYEINQRELPLALATFKALLE